MIADAETTGKVYGYARRSDDKQILSLETQCDRIHEEALKQGWPVEFIFSETGTAEGVSWRNRPAMQDAFQALRKGDILIVWQLERIDREYHRMWDAAKALSDRGVQLVILDWDGRPLDLGTPDGRFFFSLALYLSEKTRDARKESVARGTERLRQGPLWFRSGGACKPRPGRHWVWVEVGEEFKTRSGHTHRQQEAWHDGECEQIRELWYRWNHLHQTKIAMGREFRKRRLKTGMGTEWVPMATVHSVECRTARRGSRPLGAWGCFGTEPCAHWPNYNRIHRVLDWYEKELKAGTLPPHLELSPAKLADLKRDTSATDADTYHIRSE